MAKQLKAAKSSTNRRYFTLLIILVLALAGILGALMVLHSDPQHSLPAKYASVACTPDEEEPILFDGQNPGEGMAVLQRNKAASITSANLHGSDIYITLGDRWNATVLARMNNTAATDSISTNITVPGYYRTGAVSFHIYYTLSNGECNDRWREVWVQ